MVNTKYYKGDIGTSAIFMDPPKELCGKINVVPEMGNVMGLAVMYHGGEPCTDDKEVLLKVRDGLVEAKKYWLGMGYGNLEKFAKEDLWADVNWNGSAFHMRLQNENVHYGYPKEGFVMWMDSAAVLKDVGNMEEAIIFQNFIMEPENAALISEFARYATGVMGSEEFMPEDMKSEREIVIPEELKDKGVFIPTCAPDVQALYTRIWTDLQK